MSSVLAVNAAAVAFQFEFLGVPGTLKFLDESGVRHVVLMPLRAIDLSEIPPEWVLGWEEAWKLQYGGFKGIFNDSLRLYLFGAHPEIDEAWLRENYPPSQYLVSDERAGAFVIEMRTEVNPDIDFYLNSKSVCFDTLHAPTVPGWVAALPRINVAEIHLHLTVGEARGILKGKPPVWTRSVLEVVSMQLGQKRLQDLPVVLEVNPAFTALYGLKPIVEYARSTMPWLE